MVGYGVLLTLTQCTLLRRQLEIQATVSRLSATSPWYERAAKAISTCTSLLRAVMVVAIGIHCQVECTTWAVYCLGCKSQSFRAPSTRFTILHAWITLMHLNGSYAGIEFCSCIRAA